MARNIFFSFDYDDVKNFKVNVVRNNWLTKNRDNSFVDGSIWEESKTKGDTAIEKLIEQGLNKTSVTTVLIGQNTANRRWVNYEIIKSFDKGNGIIGIYINRIKGKSGLTARGNNPLDRLGLTISEDGSKIYFYELVNRKWQTYSDLPIINNKKSNTLHFGNHWWNGNNYGDFLKLSQLFKTDCWDLDDGNTNFTAWIEEAAVQAGR